MSLINYLKEGYSSYKREKHIQKYIHHHGATHACPKCNVWEHDGNRITTEYYDRETDKRTCGECGFIWRSFFCPAGHVWDGENFVEDIDE